VPYSEVTDLLTGDIPLPGGLVPAKFLQDAQDEIDGALGQMYVTPFVLDDSDPAVRPTRLALKRISNMLASGRLILSLDVSGEKNNLHAYGLSLVNEAHAALTLLRASADTLPGATPLPKTGIEQANRGPRIKNEDDHSHVAAFYDYVSPGNRPVGGIW
jgi:hypothetical protein